MKFLFSSFLFVVCTKMLFAQQQMVLTKYFDSSFNIIDKEYAAYYTNFSNIQDGYFAETYSIKSGKLFSKGMYKDLFLKKQNGCVIKYNSNGLKIDSSQWIEGERNYFFCYFEYYPSNQLKDSIYITQFEKSYFVFYENGKLLGYSKINFKTNKYEHLAFDSTDKEIKDFIVAKDPTFKNSINDWTFYLQNNLRVNTPTNNGAGTGKYTVIVSFEVDENGNTKNITALNNPGFGTAEEAVRVIQKSGKWKPAIYLNKPKLYRHKLSITFMVSAD